MKKCKNCQQHKSLSEFSLAKSNKDGRSNRCKPCVVRHNTEYWRTPKGRMSSTYAVQCVNSRARGHAAPTYTRQQLTEWAIQHGLDTLIQNWKAQGYLKDFTPSVDRLNDALGYSLENIRLVTWQENNEKMYENRKSCIRITKQNRKVKQFDLQGNELTTYDSIANAARTTGITRININDVCRKKKHCLTAGGFYWEYVEEAA